jgi:Tol biopolymer transport system component
LGALGGALASSSRALGTTKTLGTIAYVAGGGLSIRGLPDGEPRNLVSGALSSPRFSPSGKWISYTQSGIVYVVSIDGDEVRRIGNVTARWSPVADDLWTTDDNGEGLRLFRARNDWTAPVAVIPGGSLGVFSPDGREMIYTDGDPASDEDHPVTRLSRVALAGGAEPKIVESTNEVWFPCLWTRDGGSIVFWRQEERSVSETSDGDELFLISATGGKPRSLGVTTLLNDDFLDLSPARNELAVTAGEERNEWHNKRAAVVDLDHFIVHYLHGPDMVGLSPAWSPDGNYVAYSGGPAPAPDEEMDLECGCDEASRKRLNELLSRRHIRVSNRMGSGEAPRQLTSDSRYHDEEPLWSADGSHILFTRSDSPYTDIHTLDSDQKTLWLAGLGGSDPVQVAGPLYVDPDLVDGDRRSAFDWFRGA